MNGNFIRFPNLPEKKVTFFAAQAKPDIIKALESLGASCISLENPVLPDELKCHSDMLLCHTGGKNIFLDSTQTESAQILKDEGFSVTLCPDIKNSYPDDVKLNAAVCSTCFIGNRKTISTELFNTLKDSGKNFIQINQGYSKCSICFLSDRAVITDDEAGAAVLKKQNFEVLLISKGDIYLSDRHYGFFGGSSGKINKNTLAITGKLSYHRDCDKIFGFTKEHDIDIIELSDGPITDIGGILPLKEEI